MHANYTGHITSAEWRWVVVVSSALVLLALTPFLWVVLSSPNQWQFMGAIHEYPIAASELAKVIQGANGNLLARFLHTPEPHNPVLLDTIYVLLGHISRLTALPQLVIFHVARIGATLFMYMALYSLAATIWMRVRTRRIFFALAVTGSGLGWLFSALTANYSYLDITPSTIYPFHTTLINVHYPLVIACQALITSAIISAIRPGAYQDPDVTNEGVVVFIFSLLLALLYPHAFIPIAVGFLTLLLLRVRQPRQISAREWRWMLWFFVPALPLFAYYISLFIYNPVVTRIWIQSSFEATPSVITFLLSLGLPLVIALPGIIRAVRKFEPDGNQFMIVWLATMIALVYLVPVVRLNFAIGLMIPIAYFGARSIEDYWFNLISRTWRFRVLTAVVALMTVSHFYVLFIPVSPITTGGRAAAAGMLLERDYIATFQWLQRNGLKDSVVLASPRVSVWLPAWSGMRVVYGYAAETLDASTKRRAVLDWYKTEDRASCERLLNGALSQNGTYQVSYIVYGPQERALGDAPCLDLLTLRVQSGSVMIYEYTRDPNQPQ